MLRVTIELVPRGIEDAKRTLHVLEISNDGTGDSRMLQLRRNPEC